MLRFKQLIKEKEEAVDRHIETFEQLGYKTKKISSKRFALMIDEGDRVQLLKQIAEDHNGTYHPVHSASTAGLTMLDEKVSMVVKGLKSASTGSSMTKTVEAAQCVYAAACWIGKGYDVPELRAANRRLCRTDEKIENVLKKVSPDWVKSSIIVAEALKKEFGRGTFTFHRGSAFVRRLEVQWLKLNRKEKEFSNLNKWNPSDIYMVSPQGEKLRFGRTRTIAELNTELKKAMEKRDLIGVSLKKVTKRATIKYMNYDPNDMLSHKYKGYSLGKRGFFKSKDVYLEYDSGEIQFRTFPVWQGEIKGQSANMGKISGGPIGNIMKRKAHVNITKQGDMPDEKTTRYVNRMWNYYKELDKEFSEEEFFAELEKKDERWFVSKYLGLEFLHHVVNSPHKDDVVTGILGYASSQSDLSAPYIKVS